MPNEPYDIRHYRFLRSQPPQIKDIPFVEVECPKVNRTDRIIMWAIVIGLSALITWAQWL